VSSNIAQIVEKGPPWELGELISIRIEAGTFMNEWWIAVGQSGFYWHRRLRSFRYEYCEMDARQFLAALGWV
jgi:hypothetical protein